VSFAFSSSTCSGSEVRPEDFAGFHRSDLKTLETPDGDFGSVLVPLRASKPASRSPVAEPGPVCIDAFSLSYVGVDAPDELATGDRGRSGVAICMTHDL
jgi:hypothetical protein